MKVCTSCNKEVTNDYVEFKCPNCLKNRIIRCNHCKSVSAEYKCRDCNFIGP